jgi:hypothetical protein
LGFLGLDGLAAKTHGFEGWKSFDFLGFSRPNRAFSMGCDGLSLNEFLAPSCRRAVAWKTASLNFWLAGRDGFLMGKA